MDTIRRRDVGVGEKDKASVREGLREGRVGWGGMNNSLTGGMKQLQRVFRAVW